MKNKIAITGKMVSGKSTLSKQLSKTMGYQIISISSSINQTAALLIENEKLLNEYLFSKIENYRIASILFETLTSTFQKKFMNTRVTWSKDSKGKFIKTQPYRELLQMVATSGRALMGEGIWCEFTKSDVLDLNNRNIPVIIDDLRLPSEKKFFEDFGFDIIRLDIESNEQRRRLLQLYGDINEDLLNHSTETALDNEDFLYRIDTTNKTEDEAFRTLLEMIENQPLNTLIT